MQKAKSQAEVMREMSYKIDKHLTLTNKGSKGKNTPQWLVVHFVGATGQAWDNARYFRSVYRGASAHYFVDKGNIVQVVEDDTPAWHVGDGSRSGVGKYNGYHGYGATNNNSIGFELCLDTSTASSVWHMEFHPDTLKRAERLIKEKQKQYNIPNERVIRHFDASGKLCPGNWQFNNWAKWWAFKNRLANVKGGTLATPSKDEGKPSVNAKTHLVETGETLYAIANKYGTSVSKLADWNDLDDPTLIFPETLLFVAEPKKEEPKTDIDRLARDTIAGKYGNGDERKRRLGSNYNKVMQRVNELLGVTSKSKPASKPQTKSIDQLAREVIDGKHGSGDAREKSLGSRFGAVQARVNQLLGASPSSSTKSIDQLAREVIDGKHGSGDARRKSLGSRYSAVQAKVNQLLGSGGKSGSSVPKRVVDDVIAGKYGDGATRERRLRSAGYNPQAVQREVNKRYK